MVTRTSEVKGIGLDNYEVTLGEMYYHVRKEGGEWAVDVFDADTTKSDDEAHVTSETFKKNSEVMDFIESDAQSNTEDKLILDRKAIKEALKTPRTSRDATLEARFSGKSDKQLEQKLNQLSEKNVSNEEFDAIIAELKRRNKARGNERKHDLPDVKRPRKKRASSGPRTPGAPRVPKAPGSKTSGWAKLKETMSSSGAAKARLAQGGHTTSYVKVLENLVRYWEKRGK